MSRDVVTVAHEGAEDLAVDDRVRFDGKATSWRVRAATTDGRYTLLTASQFGKVLYTIIDWHESVRGAMNVLGGGLGIYSTSGPDDAIDDAIDRLQGTGRWGDDECRSDRWEVSHRNRVPLRIDRVTRA